MKHRTLPTPKLAPAAVEARLAPDCMSAELIVPAGLSRDNISLDQCLQALQDVGVPVTDAIRAEINVLRNATPKQPRPQDRPRRFTVARGAKPQPGADGYVEWRVHSNCETAPDDKEQVNYYERCALIFVQAGQVLGVVHPPVPGVDGIDVTGNPLAPPPAKPAQLMLDRTTHLEGEQLIANVSGVLRRSGPAVTIYELVELDSNIDFATGNIDFKGSVRIKGNVLDLFTVRATGDIEVRGLIEAATIEAGGKLAALGGISGWPHGMIRTGDDCTARFLDRVRGEIAGTLCVEHEILSCELTVGRGIDVTNGRIIGGEIRLTGPLSAGIIGGDSSVKTTIVTDPGPDLCITIHEEVHPGTLIYFASRQLYFHELVRGPLQITMSETGQLVFREGAGHTHLLHVLRGARFIEH